MEDIHTPLFRGGVMSVYVGSWDFMKMNYKLNVIIQRGSIRSETGDTTNTPFYRVL